MNLAMLMGTEVKGQVPTKYRVQHLDGRPENMIVKQQMLKPINCKVLWLFLYFHSVFKFFCKNR